MWARASLVCVAWSLFLAPGIFGPVGFAAEMVAVWRGAKVQGAAGVSASAVAAVTGDLWM